MRPLGLRKRAGSVLDQATHADVVDEHERRKREADRFDGSDDTIVTCLPMDRDAARSIASVAVALKAKVHWSRPKGLQLAMRHFEACRRHTAHIGRGADVDITRIVSAALQCGHPMYS